MYLFCICLIFVFAIMIKIYESIQSLAFRMTRRNVAFDLVYISVVVCFVLVFIFVSVYKYVIVFATIIIYPRPNIPGARTQVHLRPVAFVYLSHR